MSTYWNLCLPISEFRYNEVTHDDKDKMKNSATPHWFDVVVVGMGPAGATTAHALSQSGFSVLGLEKQRHPRYKVCGGALSARSAQCLPKDFMSIIEGTVQRIKFSYSPDESYLVDLPEPIAYMVMRSRFDGWLVDHARQAGTEIHEDEPVVNLSQDSEGVEVTTKKGRYRTRFVVGADGALSVVAQRLFPASRSRTIPALESELPYNGSTHYFGESRTALISLSPATKGYAWIFPKREGLSLGVGEFVPGMTKPKQSFQTFTTTEPSLAELTVPPPLGHPIPIFNHAHSLNDQTRTGTLANRYALLVGDAGHLVDPLLGEGIFYAVRSGQLAATCITAALRDPERTLGDYESAIAQAFGREFQIASRLSRVVYDLPRSWHRWIARTFPLGYQKVLYHYCEMLQGKETYHTLWARIVCHLKGPFGKLRLPGKTNGE